jgi:hypothetical protein
MILEKRSVRLCEWISTFLDSIKSKKSVSNSDWKNISSGCLHPKNHLVQHM